MAIRRWLPLMLLLAACAAPKHTVLMKVGDFTLVDQDGHTFHSRSLQGHPSLLFFGYTHCPDACPTTMAKVARTYRKLGPDAADIPTLFVSVDPRDTPDVLKTYLSYFAAVPTKGLTGSKAQIDAVVKAFGARYEIRDSGSVAGPMIDHTIRLYLLDGNRNVVRAFDPAATPDEIAAAVREIRK
jgi:protein SCO1/2